MRPIMAAIALLWLASACNAEAHDPGKEAFCYGMDELAKELRAGEITSRAEVADRILMLAIEGQESPDEDFVRHLGAFTEGIPTGEPASVEVMNAVADDCSDYADIDSIF